MTQAELNEILCRGRRFFREIIINNHIRNTEKCRSLSEFKSNPFLTRYLANFLSGNADPVSIAKALVYPRVLGTSITTSFGTNIQNFCANVFPDSMRSAIQGIDIEFIDCSDGRRKFCQLKSGPETINSDDIETLRSGFRGMEDVARNDIVIGIIYGNSAELNNSYQRIGTEYPIFIGQDFWHRLTGEPDFYTQFAHAIDEVAQEIDGAALVEDVVQSLANEIRQVGL